MSAESQRLRHQSDRCQAVVIAAVGKDRVSIPVNHLALLGQELKSAADALEREAAAYSRLVKEVAHYHSERVEREMTEGETK